MRQVPDFIKLESSASFDVVIKKGNESLAIIKSEGGDPEKVFTELNGDV